jgi:hypothetical protein
MDPAPGYDALLPHDIMHMAVEAGLGLKLGVFGQLAAGGLAGTFRIVTDESLGKRETSRLKRKAESRDKALLKRGTNDSAASERATYLCWYEWLRRSDDPTLRSSSTRMAENAKHVRSTTPPDEIAALSEPVLDRICNHLDELSACWSGLAVGEKMRVRWPDLAASASR